MLELPIREMIEALESDGDYRVLRRVCIEEGQVVTADEVEGTSVGAALDVETTGLAVESDKIIELSIRRFRFDPMGRITKLDRAYSWLEDPGEPLEPEIKRLTGLTGEQLMGCAIDGRRTMPRVRVR